MAFRLLWKSPGFKTSLEFNLLPLLLLVFMDQVVIGDSDASGTWKLYDQKELELMMERERQEKARKEEEKRKIQEEADRANRERDLKASILPSEFFRTGEYEGKFSTYDEAGIPLTDDQHTELTKSKRKNLAKIHTAHVKNHEKWKKRNASQ
uniref:Uncharacterized protein n=1 Tax=Rhodosorus marinus TaxID=101924 RepID=A0A7S2ZB45_9RHOD|mmetsp:Transcript_10715/g.44631  ORF Transcript_10715/g.44631 Transcript_10715/m.44631 type:complete len:152 (+) Transcript_10715:1888-2343(+)